MRGNDPNAPEAREDLREGVRQGILDALGRDIDRSSASTAKRVAAAGALGIAGAVGSVALFSGDWLASGDSWHPTICAAAWAGILVACFDVVLLRIRLERFALAQACILALVGLGFAAFLALLCPGHHVLSWWSSTSPGNLAIAQGGPPASAFCLGACSALLVGAGARIALALRGLTFRDAALPAILLALVLWPAVLLQTAVASAPTIASASAGLFAGCYAGVALGRWPARRLIRKGS